MPQIIDVPGQGQIEFPDSMNDADIVSAVKKLSNNQQGAPLPAGIPPNRPPPSAPARLDAVEPPNWLERQLAKLPSLPSGVESNLRGFAMGAADPSVGLAQLGANLIGQGGRINPAIQAKEQEYQQGRQAAGRGGVDLSRAAGNLAITAPVAPVAKTLQGSAVLGGALGLANPVTEGDFIEEKIRQGALGAAGGAAGNMIGRGVARVLNPEATARIAGLREAGIQPTIGQTLGGTLGRIEEKAQSVPILGDAITAARGRAREQFNTATINKALAPIGEKVSESGQAGIREAGDKLSAEYSRVLNNLGGVKLDKQFGQDLSQLSQMATGLTPPMAGRFERIVQDNLLGKVSPNGSLTAETLKQAESEIGKKAASFSSVGGEQGELGDALKQVVNLLRENTSRASPEAAKAIRAADQGWANLVRIEKAGAAAKGNEGVFTPGQLLNAVRQSDTSVRDRATARGTALMQDWATQGQKVLGDKYPDSGTAGRLALGALGLGAGTVNPAIPAALIGGAGAYLPPLQRALVSAAADRPDSMRALAQLLRQNPQLLAIPGATAAQGIGN